jgi:hypothetical protein
MTTSIVIYHSGLIIINEIDSYEFGEWRRRLFYW